MVVVDTVAVAKAASGEATRNSRALSVAFVATALCRPCHSVIESKTPRRSEATTTREGFSEGFGQGWIRTSEGVKPADLQSAPFGHFGTYPLREGVHISSRPIACNWHQLPEAVDSARPTVTFLRWRFCGIFWFGLFLILTFCFVVLFEYGPRDFANGAQKEYARVKSFVVKRTEEIGQSKKDR